MSFEISWDKQALQDLEKLDIFIRKRIVKKILEFAETETFHGTKRMQGYEKTYRLRAGDYRVIFEVVNSGIAILKIGHRKNIY